MKSFADLNEAEKLSIKRLKEKGLTYAEIAQRIGTDKKTVQLLIKQQKPFSTGIR